MGEPEKGDWVKVWALVTDPDPHPEDYNVRFESHNEHYKGLVRRDHVVFVEGETPEGVPQCTSLYGGTATPGLLWRCEKVAEHPRKHTANDGLKWTDEQAAGYFEER